MELVRLFTDEYKRLNGNVKDYLIENPAVVNLNPSFNKYCIDLEVYDLPFLFG